MKKVFLSLIFLGIIFFGFAQQDQKICLLVRADDMGSFHAANVGCIQSYHEGIVRSIELMPVCSWFPEAVKILKENPGCDVGIHLTLTSEWSNVKWRPLTHCPSLVDQDGYFFPMVWKNENFPPCSSISESDWKLEEIEQELRAQIYLAMVHVPNISHYSIHMGFDGLDPKIGELVDKLAKEYGLEVNTEGLQYFVGWGKDIPIEQRIEQFCENLEKLLPGKYLFVEHPAEDTKEMETVGHPGYQNVGKDRGEVTRVFTSEKVKQVFQKKGIKLISYSDLKE
ncbi:polysaccharide deacetylase family protein [Anaerorudis cellulosivorans]|uniref:polysaccharide deacetylase family protein n=1 Tax=Anaerorudis cellulosivorans TaxID=3397862 RepID=UPI0022209782|nr:polysaccharide deacetylase family protein [Seramator thermalis]MCW1735468.1 polysaccharide deacetylase family protein [Seramator thermalis]